MTWLVTNGLHAELLERLGALLASGEIAAGTVLRAEELEGRFGVSRTVVRETVRVLESMGMVRSRRRVGTTVAPRGALERLRPHGHPVAAGRQGRDEQLRSLSELRAGFEPVAAALAARRATPEQCGALTGAVMDMAVHGRSGDLGGLPRRRRAFHRTCCGVGQRDARRARTRGGRGTLRPHAPRPHARHAGAAAVRLHGDVAEAVQSRDAAGARRAMQAIIRRRRRRCWALPRARPTRSTRLTPGRARPIGPVLFVLLRNLHQTCV